MDCISGYYLDPNDDGACKECNTLLVSCSTCDVITVSSVLTVSCTACSENYLLYDSSLSIHRCSGTCNDGTYPSDLSRECECN